MSNLATGHRQVLESWSDMEIKRKNLFFQNNHMSENKFPVKTIILVDFLKKLSKNFIFWKMSNLATGHRQVLESWSDMEIKRKNLFFQNNYMSENKFPVKIIILVDFLKKISKNCIFQKMSNLATGHRQVLESWSDMEMKRKSLV